MTGNHFIIKTDQKSLKWLMEQKISTPFQQFWLSKLLGYDYEIQYKKGVDNVVANALSRVQGAEILCLVITVISSDLEDLIKESYNLDPTLATMLSQLQQKVHIPHYILQNGLIKKHNRVVVGPDLVLRNKILHRHHATAESGHSGRDITLKKDKTYFYLEGSI